MTSMPAQQRFGLLAPVGFDIADDDIHLGFDLARGFEHGIGLAHAGAIAQENFHFAAFRLLFSGFSPLQYLVAVGVQISF